MTVAAVTPDVADAPGAAADDPARHYDDDGVLDDLAQLARVTDADEMTTLNRRVIARVATPKVQRLIDGDANYAMLLAYALRRATTHMVAQHDQHAWLRNRAVFTLLKDYEDAERAFRTFFEPFRLRRKILRQGYMQASEGGPKVPLTPAQERDLAWTAEEEVEIRRRRKAKNDAQNKPGVLWPKDLQKMLGLTHTSHITYIRQHLSAQGFLPIDEATEGPAAEVLKREFPATNAFHHEKIKLGEIEQDVYRKLMAPTDRGGHGMTGADLTRLVDWSDGRITQIRKMRK